MAIVSHCATRRQQFTQESERGDENISKVMYAALAVTVGTIIVAAITAFVNGKLPVIGGQ
ncbi:hypothetical protein [Amycolatopsis aidingensis]|uniref:hypothetical protein n=1 Tax=Amycolatopsis aidingensis TaxID=2842453 RepID=UPI001C0C8CC5|nr:hypothetical protein [Amycolatopsis aidingensis]